MAEAAQGQDESKQGCGLRQNSLGQLWGCHTSSQGARSAGSQGVGLSPSHTHRQLPKGPHTGRDITPRHFWFSAGVGKMPQEPEGRLLRKSCRCRHLRQEHTPAGGGERRPRRSCVHHTTRLLGILQGSYPPHGPSTTPLPRCPGGVEAKLQPSYLGDFGFSGDRTSPLCL